MSIKIGDRIRYKGVEGRLKEFTPDQWASEARANVTMEREYIHRGQYCHEELLLPNVSLRDFEFIRSYEDISGGSDTTETLRNGPDTMKVKLDPGAFIPTRAHEWDGGLDLYAPYEFTVPRCELERKKKAGFTVGVEIGSFTIDTGVHVQIPKGYVGLVKAKSGLNTKHGLDCTGVIDAGYTGSIVVKLYNHTAEPHWFCRGDKIAQLVIVPVFTPELVETGELEETERGTDGFGSTGR